MSGSLICPCEAFCSAHGLWPGAILGWLVADGERLEQIDWQVLANCGCDLVLLSEILLYILKYKHNIFYNVELRAV
ncbi:MAG: hypothetical protein KZQ73_06790 [Candidatus Thiodiazotropha sp. (ex Semelilucina semeliformis)]|nr:hypothetical protein [Candidatus Thiodiazotropha sp. (ex Semelilucina semeliformis)]MCU7828038.1 hypothetical protein [Candidatus Thiodiazotropha sp. (ex Myrtea sp. 'scaly one' KF741663)]